MAQIDEQELAVARLYAEAMRRLAPAGAERSMLGELEELLDLLDRRPEIERMFTSPLVDTDSRRQTLERAFRGQVSDLLLDSLQVMNQKGRLGLVRAFTAAYRQEIERAEGIVEVQVTSAVPLGEEQRRQVETAAGRMVGATARLAETVDPSLIGGMVIKAGDRKVDTSVSAEIEAVGARLMKRSSKELLSGKSYLSEE